MAYADTIQPTEAELAAARHVHHCNDKRRAERYQGIVFHEVTLADGRVLQRSRDVSRWSGSFAYGEWSAWEVLTPERQAWLAKVRSLL